jgi:hypothetical protein
MKSFLKNVRDIAIAGFFALLPVYVLLLILEKAWKAFHTLGAGVAGIFGMPPVLGVGGNTIFTAILVVAVWVICGLLVRFTFIGAFSRAAEATMAKYIPDYARYKSMAEEKLQHKAKALDYTTALIRWQDYWRPAYIIEQDKNGNCVVFVPNAPETSNGRILFATQQQVRVVSTVTANQLDECLKKLGRGLCVGYGIHG